MTACDVISLYTQLENLNITIWVDGGWCVDALIGEQTRPHKDLDVAIQQKDVSGLRQLLQEQGALTPSQRQALDSAVNELQQRVAAAQNEAQSSLREHLTQEIEAAHSRLRSELQSTLEGSQANATENLKAITHELHKQIEEHGTYRVNAIREAFDAHSQKLEETRARAAEIVERLEQFPVRFETAQQQAVHGFQSQLDDVLTLHRNELHRRSETLFEEIHSRIRSSFEAANSEALEKFDQQVQSMVEPHIRQTEEAIHRLAGGRSLLDAAMTMQQDRIRNSADEAFAESLSRFRENLGSVEQLLTESAQTITSRHMDDLEGKAVDLKHQSAEELYKTAEWYEKKIQTQLQGLTEKTVDETAKQLREKAGEISGTFANELNNTSRAFSLQTRQQMEEAVHDAFERIRNLFAEAADTTSAAFTDEIQRNARQELEGFAELANRRAEETRERLDASRAEFDHKLTTQQDEFLRRFQSAMNDSVVRGVVDAQEKVQAGFASLWESWKKMHEANITEIRSVFSKLNDENAEQYRSRLENISNTWMVATVATLDHQSRDVIAKIAATAEDRLREATAQVFAQFGETLRERLSQIAAGFDKPGPKQS